MKRIKKRILFLLIVLLTVMLKLPDATNSILDYFKEITGQQIEESVKSTFDELNEAFDDFKNSLNDKESSTPKDNVAEDSMEVHFIDVGQGDCILIKSDEGNILIDAGDNNKGTLVQNYLTKQGVDKIDCFILTHPDADHIGGADVIITKFEVGQIYMPDYSKDTKTYEDVMNAISYYNVKNNIVTMSEYISVGSIDLTLYVPLKQHENANNNSLVTCVKFHDNTFLFMGDAEMEEESDLLSQNLLSDVDVLKVAHHGSKTSTSENFLKTTNPEYAVISCGKDNEYGHPHASALNSLRMQGVATFRTDEQGSIIATCNGQNITWNCAPSTTWQTGE